MNKGIFKNARLRLTIFYLAIIMVIALMFSSVIYGLANGEIDRQSREQRNMIHDVISRNFIAPPNIDELDIARGEAQGAARKRLLSRLALFNIIVLSSGGFLAYLFAGRTLEPIEEAHEAQKRFAADAAHELRTPLTAMKLENEVILRAQSPSTEELTQQLKSNLEEIDRLENLSSLLLELARLEGRQLPLEPLKIAKTLGLATERVAKQAAAKKIDLRTIVKPFQLTIKANSESIVELLVILLDNAIKYSDSGSTVTLAAKKKDKSITIQVIDNGQGIEQVDLPHIFERFYRAEKSRTTNGYGLGLALAMEIARANNMTLSAKSELGNGTTLTLS